MSARFTRWFFKMAFKLLTRLDVTGLENIPPSGPYIITANHMSRTDPPLLFIYFGRENITGWVAAKYRRNLFFSQMVKFGNPIYIRRGEVDRQALDTAVKALKAGKVFGMAPEGTRSRTGSLIRGKTGIAYLADQANAPILPVAITGTESAFRKLLRLRRPQVTLQIGELFHLPPIDPQERNVNLRQNADEVMCRIAAMLPEKYRGVYTDHPRLEELLETQ